MRHRQAGLEPAIPLGEAPQPGREPERALDKRLPRRVEHIVVAPAVKHVHAGRVTVLHLERPDVEVVLVIVGIEEELGRVADGVNRAGRVMVAEQAEVGQGPPDDHEHQAHEGRMGETQLALVFVDEAAPVFRHTVNGLLSETTNRTRNIWYAMVMRAIPELLWTGC